MQHAEIIVSGLVQAVGYRYMVAELARVHKIAGEVKNLDDGTVCISCEGEEDALKKFIDAIQHVDAPACVDDVAVTYSQATGQYKIFRVVIGDIGTEIAEGHATAAMYLRDIKTVQYQMLDKQDQMLDKQDQMIDKQDQMIDKQDQMLDKQDQMIDKQDQTITEIRLLSSSMRETMNARFQKIEDDIKILKAKIAA